MLTELKPLSTSLWPNVPANDEQLAVMPTAYFLSRVRGSVVATLLCYNSGIALPQS